jgi:hypothetical protein
MENDVQPSLQRLAAFSLSSTKDGYHTTTTTHRVHTHTCNPNPKKKKKKRGYRLSLVRRRRFITPTTCGRRRRHNNTTTKKDLRPFTLSSSQENPGNMLRSRTPVFLFFVFIDLFQIVVVLPPLFIVPFLLFPPPPFLFNVL